MACRLRPLATVTLSLLSAVSFPEAPVCAKEGGSETGVALQTIVDLEETARLLAILLDSGRAVVNENHALLDDPGKIEKGFASPVFERQLMEMFRSRSGVDLKDLDAARVPTQAKTWLPELVAVSARVVAEAKPEFTRSFGGKELLPAVYGARVAARFTERTGVRMKQTSLTPRNAANAPDAAERSVLELFADPSYPREKVISETTSDSGVLRLMFPLYTTRHCLACHGEPKGAVDRTGYPREGLKLGQNAGAISVMIPLAK